jgi:tRNA threonylcarbamoyladenosine biosynthesis protein TsaB
MRIIAIETSGRYGSVSALQGEADGATPLREIALGGDQRTAQSFAPALKELLTQIDWSPKSVELVAVAVGPGSFTGLRIGVTAAKTFAYAIGANIIGVNTLAALADQASLRSAVPDDMPLWTILDAQRQELFAARFAADEHGRYTIDCDTSIIAQDVWLVQLRTGEAVVGPPLRTLKARLPEGVIALPENAWQPMATSVGRVGWIGYQSGRRDDLWQLLPNYYRKSAAEEKLAHRKLP